MSLAGHQAAVLLFCTEVFPAVPESPFAYLSPAMSCIYSLRIFEVLPDLTVHAQLNALPCSRLLKSAKGFWLLTDRSLVPADDQHRFPLLGNRKRCGILVHGESS